YPLAAPSVGNKMKSNITGHHLYSITLFGIIYASSILAQESLPEATGSLSFEIRDAISEMLIPGKLVFLQGDTVVDLGVKSRGLLASRKNTIYTANGQGTVSIPVGDYEVWARR
ncbi:MAG: hypothetical protein ACE5I1_29565, partial [bacterium]